MKEKEMYLSENDLEMIIKNMEMQRKILKKGIKKAKKELEKLKMDKNREFFKMINDFVE